MKLPGLTRAGSEARNCFWTYIDIHTEYMTYCLICYTNFNYRYIYIYISGVLCSWESAARLRLRLDAQRDTNLEVTDSLHNYGIMYPKYPSYYIAEEEEEEDGTRGYPLPYNHVPPPASRRAPEPSLPSSAGSSSGGSS